MTSSDIEARLDILRANLEKLDRIPQDSFESFASDFRNVESTLCT